MATRGAPPAIRPRIHRPSRPDVGRARIATAAIAPLLLAAIIAASPAAAGSLDSFTLEPSAGPQAADPAEADGDAMVDCLMGARDECGPSVGRAARQYSERELCDRGIIDDPARCAPSPAAAPADPALGRTRLFVVDREAEAEAEAEANEPLPSVDIEILFGLDSTVPLPQSEVHLRTLARALSDPRLSRSSFVILGHTDASGPDDYNLALSERRAEAVRDHLVTRYAIAPDRFIVAGRGESDLKNTDDPYAAENRRVQVILVE